MVGDGWVFSIQTCKDCGRDTKPIGKLISKSGVSYICEDCYLKHCKEDTPCTSCNNSPKCNHR